MTDLRFESTIDLGDGRQIISYIAVDKSSARNFDLRDYAEYAQMASAGMFRGIRASDNEQLRAEQEQAAELLNRMES